jgi:hypothetical protein
MTPSGLKAISELVEGELVLAYNETTGEIGAYPITDVISHVDPEIVLLTIDDETLETTAEHPFYELEAVPGLAVGQYHPRWTDANELKAGDLVWQADGTTGAVQSIAIVAREQRMYNLTVAGAHTFFVGDGQWLVHNGGPCGNRIAYGHAQDHLDQFADIGINDVDELANFIDDVIEYPDLSRTKLRDGREAYWRFDENDDFFGTVVIKDPKNVDGGTVFRPDEGVDYFNNLR